MSAMTTRADHWLARFDPLAGGVAIGDPSLTRQMRWLPPGTVLQPCPAGRTHHRTFEACTQPGGHPGDQHVTSTGVVFTTKEEPNVNANR